MAEAVGILEVFGLATAFVAADAGCKAANFRLEVFDKNKPANADSLTLFLPPESLSVHCSNIYARDISCQLLSRALILSILTVSSVGLGIT